jgi:hypothetical protein
MKNVIVLLIILLVACSAHALVETEVVFDLDGAINHFYEYDDFLGAHVVQDSISVPIPDANLLPGETYRVNIRFFGDEALKLINGTETIQIREWFGTGPSGTGSPKSDDASMSYNVTASRDLGATSQQTSNIACYLTNAGDYTFSGSMNIFRSNGDIIDGSILQRITFEFTAPTTVDGVPFSEYRYDNNYVGLSAVSQIVPGDVPLIEVIPCLNMPHADLNADCKVDMLDFALLMSEWLDCGLDDQDLCWP